MKFDTSKLLNPWVSVDVVVFTLENNELKVLLTKRASDPFVGSWALPGGFLLKGETTETAARRVLKEKAGVVSNVYLEQLYTFDKPGRDPRAPVFSITYFALVPVEDIKFTKTEKTENPEFVSINHLPKLAFDHKDIVSYSIKRLQAKIQYTNAAYSILPKLFTFFQLQKVYEAILERSIDKRNFRKKFMQLGLIKETKKMLRGGKQRPARLYEFISHKPAELKKFF